jgi:hypothetical protein
VATVAKHMVPHPGATACPASQICRHERASTTHVLSIEHSIRLTQSHGTVTRHSHTVHSIRSGTSRRMTHTGSVMVLEMKRFPTRPACVFEAWCYRSGRAMVKYPGIQKNAHTQKRSAMPVWYPCQTSRTPSTSDLKILHSIFHSVCLLFSCCKYCYACTCCGHLCFTHCVCHRWP